LPPPLPPGGSLSSYLSKHKVDEPLAAYLFRQLGAAIGHCHAHRMAFRDVKPNNLLLTKSNPPILKLCDFGLAQVCGEGGD
jgi:serine/threonine protein kinase